MEYHKKHWFNWANYEELCQVLKVKLEPFLSHRKGNEVVLVPLIRGGLALGLSMSHLTGFKKVVPICFRSTDGDETDYPTLNAILDNNDYKCVVFLDEITDDGTVFNKISEHVRATLKGKDLIWCSLVNLKREKGHFTEVIWASEMSDESIWYYFPWDVEN